jgi:hypothetical protein
MTRLTRLIFDINIRIISLISSSCSMSVAIRHVVSVSSWLRSCEHITNV